MWWRLLIEETPRLILTFRHFNALLWTTAAYRLHILTPCIMGTHMDSSHLLVNGETLCFAIHFKGVIYGAVTERWFKWTRDGVFLVNNLQRGIMTSETDKLNHLTQIIYNNITRFSTQGQEGSDRARDYTDYLGTAKTPGCWEKVRNLTHVADFRSTAAHVRSQGEAMAPGQVPSNIKLPLVFMSKVYMSS